MSTTTMYLVLTAVSAIPVTITSELIYNKISLEGIGVGLAVTAGLVALPFGLMSFRKKENGDIRPVVEAPINIASFVLVGSLMLMSRNIIGIEIPLPVIGLSLVPMIGMEMN